MCAIRKLMHIDGPDQVAMAGKTARAADPISVLGLMAMLASGTLATCASFGASEARDVSLFGFVGEIIDVFAILPQGHAAVMMATTITVTHTMRIAYEERTDLVEHTKVDDLPSGFLQFIASRPFRMRHPSLFMYLHAAIPDLCRLLLSGFQSDKLASRQVFKSKDAYGFHSR